jgi:hypothetical protein
MIPISRINSAFPVFIFFLAFMLPFAPRTYASNNIPLDSPVYHYLDKLASFGLISSDFKGIRPITGAEAARLLFEAEKKRIEERKRTNVDDDEESSNADFWSLIGEKRVTGGGELAREMIRELRNSLDREIALIDEPESVPYFALNPLAAYRMRYVYLDGTPRSYERPVHDPGDDGVFGIGSGLRPPNPYPSPVQQHGNEGTPLLENNEGVVYRKGSNFELRFSSEARIGRYFSALIEPMLLYSKSDDMIQGRLNKGYAKLGGGALELEVGRDANWLGLGERGNITLTNNGKNFDLVKLSSPEPVSSRYLWDLKYSVILSRFDSTVTSGQERRPFFMALKLSLKPAANLEMGINYGKEFGGPGVNNSFGAYMKGIFGGTGSDNTNNLAGVELRWRIPFLRNTEIYGEFSGEDSASFWPIVESYVGGIFIPRLSNDGSNDLRFEYFLGNSILYTSGTFPEGYIYKGLPIGHSQGGAAQDFFLRYRHWFSARSCLMLDFIHGERGNLGRVPVDASGRVDQLNGVLQAVERRNSYRIWWNFPMFDRVDVSVMYGRERIHNLNLAGGARKTNQLLTTGFSYRF